jgi:hypothetical protein
MNVKQVTKIGLAAGVAVGGGALADHHRSLYVSPAEVGNRAFFPAHQWEQSRSQWKVASAAEDGEGEEPRGLNKPPKGYKALFNGKDLTNWQGLIDVKRRATLTPEQRKTEQEKADALMRAHWAVKDGIIVFDGKGQSLQTVKDYGDIELYVDWKLQPAGDSGIYLRGNPQVQIWERTAGSAIANGKFIGSGGLFNNQKNPSRPIAVADKPMGEWNTFWIRMVGDRVTIKLNDVLVVDDTPLENYWERGKPLPEVGPVELQNHGNILEFRNIYIRELKRGK